MNYIEMYKYKYSLYPICFGNKAKEYMRSLRRFKQAGNTDRKRASVAEFTG